MADDSNQRPYRSNDPNNRGAAPAGSSATNDPLAELARLIGQNDPFAEFGRDGARRAPPQQQPAQNWNPQQQAPANYQPQQPASYQPQPAADPRIAQPAPAYGATGYHVSAPTQPRHQQAVEQQTFSGPGFDRPVAGAQGHMTGNDPYHGAYDHQAEAQQPQHAGDYEADPYYQQQAQQQGDDYYDDRPAPKRRMSVLAIAGIFMLAVVGVAGAYGYRQLFGYPGMRLPPPVIKADTAPSKVVPAASNDQKSNAKAIYDRVGDRPQAEKVVSREEAPVDIKNRPAAFPPPPAPQAATTGALQVSADPMSTEPKKIHTIVIRPDQAAMPAPAIAAAPPPPSPQPAPARAAANPPPPARVASAQPEPVAEPTRAAANHRLAPVPVVHRAEPVSSNAPLSLSPDSNAGTLPPPPPRNVSRVASVPRAEAAPAAANRPVKLAPPPVGAAAASGAHGYAVQVSSQRSEADAESSFRALQTKYPQQLGGRQPVIRRADLGAKGVYYRAMVGPFTNGSEATQLCTALKTAGGSCIIQKN